MKAGDIIRTMQAFPWGGLAELTAGQALMVMAPHPDDETLGCGGLLAAAAEAGIPAHVLVLTDGAASHRHSPSHPAPRLAALRRDEARRAAACLGLLPEALGFLDLPDAATPSQGPDFDAAVDRIAERAEAAGARSLFVTWGRDPHCDHETAYAMARAVARRLGLILWAYPVWGLHLPPDTDLDEALPTGLRLDVSRHRGIKRRAIDCYASQISDLIDDDPSAFRFTEAQLAPFLGAEEIYIAVDP